MSERQLPLQYDAFIPDMSGFRITPVDFAGAAKDVALKNPKLTGAVLAATTAALLDTNPAMAKALVESSGVGVGQIKEFIDKGVKYVTDNWLWLVPTLAVTDGLVDSTVFKIQQDKARKAANESKKKAGETNLYPMVGRNEFFTFFTQKAIGEGGEIVTTIFAANAVINPNLPVGDGLRLVGYISVGVSSIYAAFPDSFAQPINNIIRVAISAVASGVQTISARSSKQL